MKTMTIKQFCDKHAACKSGREWALSLGIRSMRKLWERDDIKPEWRLWIATRPGVMSDKDLRLFACWCSRQVWHLLTDERSRNAVEVAERYAVGDATRRELAAARAAARAAAWEAVWDAADAAGAAVAAGAAARAVQSKKLKEYIVNFEVSE